MTFCEHLALGSAATQWTAGTENVWRLNSLFDPDLTGGTHQPYGMDQMAGLYDKYIVHKCRIELLSVPQPGTAGQLALPTSVVYSVQPSSATYSLSAAILQDIAEKPFNAVRFSDLSGTNVHFSTEMNLWDVEGVTKNQYLDDVDQYAALVGATPTRTPYLRAAVINLQNTTVVYHSVLVKLTFTAEFFQRTILAASS